jgi:hypothetical protein
VLLSEIQKYGDAAPSRTFGIQVNGNHIYYYKRLASENIPKLYGRKRIGGKERLLVDPEAMKGPENQHYAIDWFSPSPDNKYIAYGLSLGGSEQSVLHVKDVATGKETGDLINRANFGPPGWTSDNRLLYNRLQKLAAVCICIHWAAIPKKTSRSSARASRRASRSTPLQSRPPPPSPGPATRLAWSPMASSASRRSTSRRSSRSPPASRTGRKSSIRATT